MKDIRERIMNLFMKIVVRGECDVKFTRKYQPFASYDENLIVLNLREGAIDSQFIDHIYKSHGYKRAYEISPQIWTALHEVGHIKTECDGDEDALMRKFCEWANDEGALPQKTINRLWYEMPDEWAATEWAIDFVKKHYIFCKLFGKAVENGK